MAVAHPMLVTPDHLLARHTTYQDPGADYYDRRHAERVRRRAIQTLACQPWVRRLTGTRWRWNAPSITALPVFDITTLVRILYDAVWALAALETGTSRVVRRTSVMIGARIIR